MFQNNLIAGSGGQGGGGFFPHEIDQSLRFNDDDSAYLSWTPSTAGNRRTWTWSGWVKRGNLGSTQQIFTVLSGGSYGNIGFTSADKLQCQLGSPRRRTNALFRDVSAWYHIIVVCDTTDSNGDDRLQIWVNGIRLTSFDEDTDPSLNAEYNFNRTFPHGLSAYPNSSNHLDGYLAEVNFIDGQALDADSFGEFKSGVWVPKEYTGTYGTNGFYLPMRETTQADGFNAVTYTGNGGTQSVNGVGFEPDLVWVKGRGNTYWHELFDTVRGTGKSLFSNTTNQEANNNTLTSFDTDGFTVVRQSGLAGTNDNGANFVAWCWDAGSGSPVSNTDGSITSTVKANTDYGFSIVTYEGNNVSGATVGHGLNSAPDMIIIKNRSSNEAWPVYHSANTSAPETDYLVLNTTAGTADATSPWNDTAPTSSVFSLGDWNALNENGSDHVAYCFHDVAGYSKFGSYTGTGASGNVVTTGFRPSFVMVKKSSASGAWSMFDDLRRDADNNWHLLANESFGEFTDQDFVFTDTGFTVGSSGGSNHSGETFIYMAFADTKDAAFYYDASGNKNNFTANGVTGTDVVLDSPTNNFATWNAVDPHPSGFLMSEGNLKLVRSTASSDLTATINIPASGAYYFEVLWTGTGTDTLIGLGQFVHQYRTNGTIYNNDTSLGTYSSYTSGDIIGVGVNADNDLISFYKNGTLVHSFTGSVTSADLSVYTYMTTGSSQVANFGQDSSFAGNKTAQGNTDENGIGDFYYTPPSGYLALCTANLPEPAFSPANDESPQDYFNTVLYTGNDSTNAITGVGFQPDLTWIKTRSAADNHNLEDAVRGAGISLNSDTTNAESDLSGSFGINTFDPDGFTLIGDGGRTNNSSRTYVAWNWKANGAGVSNTDGSITSTVSANTEAGFSIVSYTGNSTSGATVGHGLDNAPEMMIVKSRDTADHWFVYHAGISTDAETDKIQLNLTNAADDNSGYWNDTKPTSSVFTLGNNNGVNKSGDDMIAYCFHSVDGFSKIGGSYTGNGSATDGPFVYCGFRPAFVMIKRTSGSGSWRVLDDQRGENGGNDILHANLSIAEYSGFEVLDILSNGFKIKTTSTDQNSSGDTYIYMAFAENPFKYSNAR